MWLNLYGCDHRQPDRCRTASRKAVRHKLKNRQKTQKMDFQPVLEPHGHISRAYQYLSHQSFLLTQRLICENIREKILRIGDFEKRRFFESAIFLLHSYANQSKFIWRDGWVKILMSSLVSRKFLAMCIITLYSVYDHETHSTFQMICKIPPASASFFNIAVKIP